MIQLVYFICEFLFAFAKSWVSFGLIEAGAEPKVEKRTEYAVRLVVAALVAGLNTYNNSVISVLFSSAMLLIAVAILALGARSIYRKKFCDCFYLIYLFWMILAMLDFFVQTVACSILLTQGAESTVLLRVGIPRAVYLILSMLAVMWVGKILYAWLSRTNFRQYQKGSLFVSLLLFFSMTRFQTIYTYSTPGDLMNRWWIVILGGFVLTLCFAVYAIRRKEREQLRLHRVKVDMLEQNYQSLLQVYEEKAILLHDMKNHFLVMREMVQADQKSELLTYMDEINGEVLQKRSRDLTNHKLLNLILNRKIQEAEDAGMRVEYEFDDMSELRLQPMEICALFCNMLDNAIEANQKVPSDAERWMKMSCTRKYKTLIVSLANPTVGESQVDEDGIPLTTKQNKSIHGFGIQSMRQIVEKYEGHIQFDMEEGVFAVTGYLKAF